MIILISGVTRTGKTLMAQKLMEKYGYPYLSVDHIKMGLYRGLKDEKYNPEQNYSNLAEALWPVVKGIIMTAIENKQNLIVEGCYILPHMVYDFKHKYLKNIASVFLLFSDEYLVNHYESDIKGKQSIIEYREADQICPLNKLMELHQDFRTKCQENSVDFFDIRHDYETEINEVYSYLDFKHQQL